MNNRRDPDRLLVLIGPTAVGKTKLSIELAQSYNAEIISGDSMQVYCGMDIGTAKVSVQERKQIKHHLIDIRKPDESFSVSDFQQLARKTAQAISSRGRLPFLVGGTGLYVESACYDYQFMDAPGDELFRKQMHDLASEKGVHYLHEELARIDPTTARRLHPNDVRRVIRALEVFHITKVPLSEHLKNQTKKPYFNLCMICLTMDREKLYERINVRVDHMIKQGLVEEVEGLLNQGFDRSLVSMQGLGYKEIAAYLHGECSLEQAVHDLKQGTRRFAKRQLSWFRHMKDAVWVDVTDEEKNAKHLETIHAIIAGKFGLDAEYN